MQARTDIPPLKERSSIAARAARFSILCVVLLFVGVGSFWVISQVGALKRDLASTRRELAVLRDQMVRSAQRAPPTPADIVARSHVMPRTSDSGNRGPLEAPTGGPFTLSREEMQLVRDFIRLPPPPAGAMPTIIQGGAVPIGSLSPLPTQISDRIPKLNGARFLTDRNGAIVIVRRGSRNADIIVGPN